MNIKNLIFGGFMFMLGCAVTSLIKDTRAAKSELQSFEKGVDTAARAATFGFDYHKTIGLMNCECVDGEYHAFDDETNYNTMLDYISEHDMTENDIAAMRQITFVEFRDNIKPNKK